MKKVLIFIVLFIFLLSGCTKKIEKKDIANYINDKLKLNNYVINGYEEIIDSDGYKDYLWSIKDNDTNITFHILDDYSFNVLCADENLTKEMIVEELSKKDSIFVTNVDVIDDIFKRLGYEKDKHESLL